MRVASPPSGWSRRAARAELASSRATTATSSPSLATYSGSIPSSSQAAATVGAVGAFHLAFEVLDSFTRQSQGGHGSHLIAKVTGEEVTKGPTHDFVGRPTEQPFGRAPQVTTLAA
jgi:hypothetical protein